MVTLVLPEIVSLINRGEYGSAISLMEKIVKDKSKPTNERIEYCEWIAECYKKLNDLKLSGDWYLEAVKIVLSQDSEIRLKAKQALPYCEKALENYREGGDALDVMEAVKLKHRLQELSK
ncbi:MAG: hypothetical protein QXY76_05955 [Nitrososphaeria archaeon]